MKINYDWGNPVKIKRWFRFWLFLFHNKRKQGTPLHMSNHYKREHFHPEDNPQHKLF